MCHAPSRNKVILPSAARTATTNSDDQFDFACRGAVIFLSITAVPGVDTVTLSVTGKDPVSGSYVTIFTGAAESATGTKMYTIYPGVTETANVDMATVLPTVWRVTVTHSGAGSFTYSVAASVVA